ncbi:hypothetical protein [Kineobactrum salinum]|uniref:DUF485 domain-containing protein n=1 Tax=Kineobactrum salinum TaxID=2708301 RepID=A0A6C0TYQ2_9GAMM|nr:hypothetical protein [Kineobactrum salinum]QIB64931.1 hypothetical protein G3T16_05525 [Kineobactrum salinum]
MDNNQKLVFIRARTRRRLLFAALILALYFSFTLNWTGFGATLAGRLGGSYITGSLLMFAGLIVVFIALEFLFIWLNRAFEPEGE